MNKKAQGLSLNVIIIAVLALLVLVLLMYILTDGFTVWFKTLTCQGMGHTCADSCADLEGSYTIETGLSGTDGKCEPDQVCCVKVGG